MVHQPYADLSDLLDSPLDETTVQVANNTGTSEDPFYGEGTRGITETMFSRTEEVARCIQLMQQSCIDNNLASEVTIPPFMNHSFEEICWQAHDSRRAVVVVLLNPSSHHNQSRSAMLRLCVVHEINLTTQTSLFTSPNAKTVGTLYGHGDYDQIIILAPSSQQTPVFVDRVGGT
ncbi:hypothetical protein P5673_009699 [Acropora cervicornis]|uniref:Uncharacterized protein n=1 Tax=Acropora cervicornis TaxID=6130 RepID=A0AAD9QRV8_ACRCE|nr:hypothetical protein P5673_009699 [Acropora cervicornis]